MEAILILPFIYLFIYCAYIVALAIGYTKVREWIFSGSGPKSAFSIIIPFRNEAENLPSLLKSLEKLDYPHELFEIILVNDFSDDDGEHLIYKWRMANGKIHTTLLENVRISGSPKKDAIMRAIPIATSDWIVTTDADCILPSRWLLELNDFIVARKVEMVAGAVFVTGKSLSAGFERLDVMSLQGATIGGFGLKRPFMCNGANFAYKKSLFVELGGFAGNFGFAGGDDVFLLQKAAAEVPEKVGYLKSRQFLVTTKSAGSWQKLFRQRVRWASKATSYENSFAEMLSLAVFFGNLSIIAIAICGAINAISVSAVVCAFVVKFTVDYVLILQGNSFPGKKSVVFPLISSIVYPFFSVAVALVAVIGTFSWKGRKFS
ncbi:MAG: glycosyltransferase [Flavobacterium sp.]|nr:MAG: glycosyltransferase [Flavobacterium sp.]